VEEGKEPGQEGARAEERDNLTEDPEGTRAEFPPESPEEPPSTVDERISVLESELEDARDKYLRTLAELDNFRKRAERERADLVRNAGERLIEHLLDVLDGFDQALAMDVEGVGGESYAEGIGLLRDRLLSVLEREGVTEIESIGQPFDPNIHEAMIQVESDEYPSDTVVEELRKGYLLNDRLLRAARVAVAK
jgi:molecular chaperone GrpE